MLCAKNIRRNTLKKYLLTRCATIFAACFNIAPSSADSDLCPTFQPVPSTTHSGEIRINADSAISNDANLLMLEGNVSLRQGTQQLSAQHIDYHRSTGELSANGSVHYIDQDIELHSASMAANTNSNTLQTGPARFNVNLKHKKPAPNLPQRGRGEATSVVRTQTGVVKLEDVGYTHCPPKNTDWALSAASMTFDPNSAEGTAQHVSIAFKGVPFVYLPWFRFPIDDVRKSGLLPPSITRSETRGVEVSVPWYWNIAPQADATITPRNMTRRGLQLQSQWRYLSTWGHWQLDNAYLENDTRTNSRREFTQLRQSGTPLPGWTSNINISRASDADYFNDFGESFELSSLTHLERRLDLNHHADQKNWRYTFRTRLQQYQTLDSTASFSNRPYQRLPQLTFEAKTATLTRGLSFDGSAELVSFERKQSITGQRFNVQPRISLPLTEHSGFFIPALSTRHTYYRLDHNDPAKPDTISRTVPVFSLDSGLFFDRTTQNGTQTLEPRLFYLYVPFEEQADIPEFDSGSYDFSFAQLFRENRFSGADRIGDANQMALALTTRFQENSGREWAHASIGQIHYFDSRRVTLGGPNANTAERSNLVIDLGATVDHSWSANTTWQRNPERRSTDRLTTRLGYANNNNYIDLAHRFRALEHDKVDLSFNIALNDRWRTTGKWNYSLDDKRSTQTWLALEYESCCWALRTAVRRHLIGDRDGDGEQENDTTFYFEWVMKGLGNVGDSLGARLERDILNYSDRFHSFYR